MTLEQTKAYLRAGNDADDALIGAMTDTARELCEAYIGGPLVRRSLTETVPGGAAWRRLAAAPVWAIGTVEALDADGVASALPPGAWAIDIDARGEGWVRAPGAIRVRVTYDAGLAADADGVPAPLIHGVTRLAAHLYLARESGEAPPDADAALWRPWRRMRLAGEVRP